MKINEIIDYAKAMQVQGDVITWIETHFSASLEKNKVDQTEIEHIIDYLSSSKRPKRLSKMSYEQAKSNTNKWNKALIKKGKNITEKEDDIELIKDFGDGFKVVKLVGKAAYEREGALMRHCCASYHGLDKEVYSLRDKDNMPHCTIEKDQQIKGKGNGEISPKYIRYVVEFIESLGMSVGDNEMENIGYINVSKIKNKLSKKKNDFYKQFLPKNKEWYGVDGSEYCDLDLLMYKDPIFIDSSMKVRVNFDLGEFIPKAIETSIGFVKKLIASGDYSRNASSGNGSQNASSGNDSRNASSGDCSQNEVKGLNSLSVNAGRDGKVKGVGGTLIALTHYIRKGDLYIPDKIVTGKIGEGGLKENIWYGLDSNGNFQEKKNDNN